MKKTTKILSWMLALAIIMVSFFNIKVQAALPTKSITVTVSADDGLLEELVIDNVSAFNSGGISPVTEGTTTITVPDGATARELKILAAFGSSLGKITINGTEITDIPDMVEGWYTFEIDDADEYTIALESGFSSDDRTIIWNYDDPEDEETYVSHGKVEVVSIVRDGNIIYDKDHDSEDVQVDDNGGWVAIKEHDDVVLRLIPDYGYQLKSVTINDQDLEPQDDVSTFLLPDIQGNLHFSGVFVKVEDKASSTSTIAKTPTIANGKNAATSGNVNLTVKDNTTYTKDVLETVNGNATKVGSLELTLDNVVSKGNGENWTNNISEFDSPVSITLDVSSIELKAGETLSIVRDHNGELEELEATLVDGKLTFESNLFSTYTIVKKDVSGDVPTGDNSTARFIILVAVSLLAIVALTLRDKRRNITE